MQKASKKNFFAAGFLIILSNLLHNSPVFAQSIETILFEGDKDLFIELTYQLEKVKIITKFKKDANPLSSDEKKFSQHEIRCEIGAYWKNISSEKIAFENYSNFTINVSTQAGMINIATAFANMRGDVILNEDEVWSGLALPGRGIWQDKFIFEEMTENFELEKQAKALCVPDNYENLNFNETISTTDRFFIFSGERKIMHHIKIKFIFPENWKAILSSSSWTSD